MAANGMKMQSTRQRILEYLQKEGRGTVRELGELLGLTSTGIRQHLTVLERDGLVDSREERGRVGRPTLVYSLTDKADALFPKAYDTLANLLLEEIRDREGNEKLQLILQNVARRLAAPYTARVEGRSLNERVEETTQIIEEQGCLVDFTEKDGEFLINEYTCPFPKTAEQDRAVCALHVEFVRILSGGETKLVRSLMRGERSCTYRIKEAATAAAS